MTIIKDYFALSLSPSLWLGKKKVVCISKYIPHLAKTQGISNVVFDSIKPNFESDETLQKISDRVNDKYVVVVKELANRLNEIHGLNYSNDFWDKILSVNFLRYVTDVYDFYELCENNFSAAEYDFGVLKKEGFIIPEDFEEQRDVFLNSLYGNEILFRLYCEFKGVEISNEYELDKPLLSKRKGVSLSENNLNKTPKISYKSIKKHIKLCLKLPLSSSKKQDFFQVRSFFKKIITRPAYVCVLGTYFQDHYMHKLGDRFFKLDFSSIDYTKSKKVNYIFRDRLAQPLNSDLTFDNFLFSSLRYTFPKYLVENFKEFNDSCNRIVKSLPKLSHVIAEAWISNGYQSYIVALLQHKNIIHVNNEHNVISHPYVGDFSGFIKSHSDLYYTIGWSDKVDVKIVRGASLTFPFEKLQDDTKEKCKYKFLYVSGPYQAKLPLYSSLYSLCGDSFFSHHFSFIELFFETLSESTKENMSFRPYPKNYAIPILTYDKDFLLQNHLKDLNIVDDFSIKALELYVDYELIILDYISKSFLEVLIANKPMIVLWPPNTYTLKKEYKDIYDELVHVGVFQVDAKSAANFLEKNMMNIGEWWNSSDVQRARNNFLNNNIGSPKDAIDFYKNMVG